MTPREFWIMGAVLLWAALWVPLLCLGIALIVRSALRWRDMRRFRRWFGRR